MKVGDRIQVSQSVVVYHHPEHRNQGFDIKGEEGEILQIIHELDGKPISANLPVVVKFGKKFRAHLREDEIEIIS
jgi:hypothetical protein